MALTYELHVIRAHLLHYTALLSDFHKSVVFVRDTHNPGMDSDSITNAERLSDKKLLAQECGHLLTEIERLQMNRQMQDDRVQNVTHLVIAQFGPGSGNNFFLTQTMQVYAMVNIEDSKAMKRLSYITMIFLPASFMAVRQSLTNYEGRY